LLRTILLCEIRSAVPEGAAAPDGTLRWTRAHRRASRQHRAGEGERTSAHDARSSPPRTTKSITGAHEARKRRDAPCRRRPRAAEARGRQGVTGAGGSAGALTAAAARGAAAGGAGAWTRGAVVPAPPSRA